jgi:hypothetical protein
VVLVDEAAEPVATADLAHERSVSSLVGLWRPELERTMRPLAVVVVNLEAEHAFEVAPVEDQEVVEILATHGPDQAAPRLRSPLALAPASSRPGCLRYGPPFAMKNNT